MLYLKKQKVKPLKANGCFKNSPPFIRYYKEAIKSGLLEDNTSIATLAQQWGDRFFNTAKASQPQDELTGLREALYLKLLCYCMKDEIIWIGGRLIGLLR
ncbi:Uncharacterised protein [Legionella feeleii]|uniref:Uncharacterized protein n=1 Tax=Legionella feeleii TaxID=453 RepID=A0A2X1R3P6_9GAMM|nr:Uncharacterised protein [Legionella feeleii]